MNKIIKTVRFTFEGERYRINIYQNEDNETFDYTLFDTYGGGAINSGEGYLTIKNTIQSAKSEHLGIDY